MSDDPSAQARIGTMTIFAQPSPTTSSQSLYVYEISLAPSTAIQLDPSPLIAGVANMFNGVISGTSSVLPALGTAAAVAASSMLLLGILCIKHVTDRIPIVGFICKELKRLERML
jgi:hypothetical protein